MLRALLNRPKLLTMVLVGIASGLGLAWLPDGPDASTSAILGWNAGCAAYCVIALRDMAGATGAAITARAHDQDEGRHLILALALVAVAASLAGVAFELASARSEPSVFRAFRSALAVVTVGASWLFTQLVFTVHYAHEFYSAHSSHQGRRGGLVFPGGEEPDYWDFFHFAVIIGVANQTADVQIASKTMRRTATLHGIVAWVFNTAVLALTINLAAGLFS